MKSIALLLIALGAAGAFEGVVLSSAGEYSVISGEAHNEFAVAWGTYNDSSGIDGWSELAISGNSKFPLPVQSCAMGFFEGFKSQKRIWQAKTNLFQNYFHNDTARDSIAEWFHAQMNYTVSQILENPDDDYWRGVNVVMQQFFCLHAGYDKASPEEEKISLLDLFIHNGAGDLEDLSGLYPSEDQENASPRIPDIDMLECSAFVGLTPDEIISGHTTWRGYYGLEPRQYKFYRFNADAPSEISVGFSSTPGFLSSKDDFYTVRKAGSVLMISETTNAVFNSDLYHKYTKPETLLTWQRTILANLFASHGKQWTEIFAKHNSGTYNNQWIIVDVQAFKYSSSFSPDRNRAVAPPNTLWILEQIPGQTMAADVTEILNKQGYWGSYNVPYFPEIYNASGYTAMNGTKYSYTDCPRANIFREKAPQIGGLEDLKYLMQYNDYEHDPLSLGSPLNAISSRYDLVKDSSRAFGGIDSKISSGRLAEKLEAWAIAGPTQQQPNFAWSNFNGTFITHSGQPDKFAFPWGIESPEW